MKKRILAMLLSMVFVASSATSVFLPVAAAGDDSAVYYNGMSTSTVTFPANQTAEIEVDEYFCDDYQWQILIPDTDIWVNIYNENNTSLVLSHALIANMLDDDDMACVRCAMTSDGETFYSDSVDVSVGEPEHEEIEISDEDEMEFRPFMMFSASPRIEEYDTQADIMSVASEDEYTIRIDYVFEDGTIAAESWIGTFTAGSSYTLDVDSPRVHGYVANKEKIEKKYASIDEDETFTVTYTPTTVEYTVTHWQQNVDNDEYTEVEGDCTIHKDKYANDAVGGGHYKAYEGFKALDYDTTTAIAADGSTVLQIYYDRLYYLMSFDLDGGYGVEPIYARYGTDISGIDNPEKPGYSFTGWDPELPETMPAENTSYTAIWTAGEKVNVNLVFWYENANDDDYTYVGSAQTTAPYSEGAKVRPSEFDHIPFTNAEDRDDIHFVFNESKDEPVDLKADGSTIINIYFTRKTYKMIFFNCRQSGHVRDFVDCYPTTREAALNYVKEFGEQVDQPLNPDGNGPWIWGISIYIRKWQQDVRKDWEAGIANRANTRRWKPYAVNGADGNNIYDGKMNVSMMNVMPDADIVFRFISEGDKECNMYYWVTPVQGVNYPDAEKKTYNGVDYVLRQHFKTYMGGITENEEFVDIEGFKKVHDKLADIQKIGELYIIDNNYKIPGNDKIKGKRTVHFLYTRMKYPLAYISEGVTVETRQVEFEGVLDGYNTDNSAYVPAYPSTLEPGAYKFEGWYLSENCADRTEVDWKNETMPVGGMSVYAKWVPVERTVTVTVEGEIQDTLTTLHGTVVDNPPDDPTKAGYKFVCWFYTDENRVEHPFTFDMPITKDITIYPKWTQEAIVKGTIYYQLEDGRQIAEPTAIEAVVGETKTYDAKCGDELYADYQDGYFPNAISHSITFDVNEEQNIYTFIYVHSDPVIYTVRYLEEETEAVLAEEKQSSSSKASVVENFVPVAGYIPDLYKKTLLLSPKKENILIFWYTKDKKYAPVRRVHYLEKISYGANEDKYEIYQDITGEIGEIGQTYRELPLTELIGTDINGFSYNEDISISTGELTKEGLVLALYYDRNEYPYEFRFVDESGKTIHESVTGTAKFEATVTQNALNIPGYELVGETIMSIEIDIEEGNTAVMNVATFVYRAAFADLTIKKTVDGELYDSNQTFLFQITGTPDDTELPAVDMTVTVSGSGEILIKSLPVGKYTVKELTSWSWRYTPDQEEQEITLVDPDASYSVTFQNILNTSKWLTGDSRANNWFNPETQKFERKDD